MTNGRLLLGAIADDYTGGSDMAGMLAGEGVRTVQTFGVPDEEVLASCRDAEAVVVSLKSRSIASRAAVEMSLQSVEQLRSLDPRQIQFKYCSTFDSTVEGNIGPVADALMRTLDVPFTIAVPALPVNGRTQYFGYLFVNGVLLSESPMRTHPLNPMTEPNLVRHLAAQTTRQVGLIDLAAVRSGADRRPEGVEIALVDAIEEADLLKIAHSYAIPFITGGSGISRMLPAVWRGEMGWSPSRTPVGRSEIAANRTLLLAGSCSAATLRQIEVWRAAGGAAEAMRIDDLGPAEVERLAAFASTHDEALIYSSAPADRRSGSPEAIEQVFAQIAETLAGTYGRLVVAGGETSGAVVEALGIRAVEIGPAIDPGVPCLRALTGLPLILALKSGNFGAPDFFSKAVRQLVTDF